MDKSTIRVLLVDDYAEWRRFVSSLLQNRSEISIIGEASTGLEAVRRAHQLQPDLILMDIGLPTLNGIEATREIRTLSPMSKILFVSQTTSSDIVEEAIRAGGAGFVAKSDVARELVEAVRAVLDGKRFVSGSLSSLVLADVEDSHVTKQNRGEEAFEVLPIERPGGRHEVKFYSDDADFVAGFAGVAEDAIKAGHAVVIIATEPHRAGVVQELAARGVDVRAVIQNGHYRSLDAAQTLENIMVHGVLDSVRCAKFMGEMVAHAANCATVGDPLVVICGECAPILLAGIRTERSGLNISGTGSRRSMPQTLSAVTWVALFRTRQTNQSSNGSARNIRLSIADERYPVCSRSSSLPLSKTIAPAMIVPSTSARNSPSGRKNSVNPQSRQTASFGKVHTIGFFRPAIPLK